MQGKMQRLPGVLPPTGGRFFDAWFTHKLKAMILYKDCVIILMNNYDGLFGPISDALLPELMSGEIR